MLESFSDPDHVARDNRMCAAAAVAKANGWDPNSRNWMLSSMRIGNCAARNPNPAPCILPNIVLVEIKAGRLGD